MRPKDLIGSVPKGLYGAKNGDGIEANLSHVVFPIIRIDEDEKISLIGTGFFIAEHGVFLTAKHVLMDVIDEDGNQTHQIALVQLHDEGYTIRPILRCTSHEIADITVGVAAAMRDPKSGRLLKNKLMKITPDLDPVGSRVATYAYPKSVIEYSGKQELYLYPDFYEGKMLDYYPNGRDQVLMPGPCFQTSIYTHGGASGGPVFNEAGIVCGVNSTGFKDDALSFATPVYTIENLLLSEVETPDSTTGEVRVRELIEHGFISYITDT